MSPYPHLFNLLAHVHHRLRHPQLGRVVRRVLFLFLFGVVPELRVSVCVWVCVWRVCVCVCVCVCV